MLYDKCIVVNMHGLSTCNDETMAEGSMHNLFRQLIVPGVGGRGVFFMLLACLTISVMQCVATDYVRVGARVAHPQSSLTLCHWRVQDQCPSDFVTHGLW